MKIGSKADWDLKWQQCSVGWGVVSCPEKHNALSTDEHTSVNTKTSFGLSGFEHDVLFLSE